MAIVLNNITRFFQPPSFLPNVDVMINLLCELNWLWGYWVRQCFNIGTKIADTHDLEKERFNLAQVSVVSVHVGWLQGKNKMAEGNGGEKCSHIGSWAAERETRQGGGNKMNSQRSHPQGPISPQLSTVHLIINGLIHQIDSSTNEVRNLIIQSSPFWTPLHFLPPELLGQGFRSKP